MDRQTQASRQSLDEKRGKRGLRAGGEDNHPVKRERRVGYGNEVSSPVDEEIAISGSKYCKTGKLMA